MERFHLLTDPKECLYCENKAVLDELMIPIAELQVSRLFLFKEQTYKGRCVVAYNEHVNDLCDLTAEQLQLFMQDVVHASEAIQKAFCPVKVNYGAYSDKLSHLHFHLAPKYEGAPDFGCTFQMNPKAVYCTPEEYEARIAAIKNNL